MEEAEAFKAQGNKFFKEKSYKNAIEQYTKGNISPPCLYASHTKSNPSLQPSNSFPSPPLFSATVPLPTCPTANTSPLSRTAHEPPT